MVKRRRGSLRFRYIGVSKREAANRRGKHDDGITSKLMSSNAMIRSTFESDVNRSMIAVDPLAGSLIFILNEHVIHEPPIFKMMFERCFRLHIQLARQIDALHATVQLISIFSIWILFSSRIVRARSNRVRHQRRALALPLSPPQPEYRGIVFESTATPSS